MVGVRSYGWTSADVLMRQAKIFKRYFEISCNSQVVQPVSHTAQLQGMSLRNAI